MKPQFANVLAGDGCFLRHFFKKKTEIISYSLGCKSLSNVRLKYNSFPDLYSGNN